MKENEEIIERLRYEINAVLDSMDCIGKDTEEYEYKSKRLSSLCDDLLKFTNAENDIKIKEEARLSAEMIDRNRLADGRKSRICQYIIGGVTVSTQMILYIWAINKGYNYEEKGIVASPTLKDSIRSFGQTVFRKK